MIKSEEINRVLLVVPSRRLVELDAEAAVRLNGLRTQSTTDPTRTRRDLEADGTTA